MNLFIFKSTTILMKAAIDIILYTFYWTSQKYAKYELYIELALAPIIFFCILLFWDLYTELLMMKYLPLIAETYFKVKGHALVKGPVLPVSLATFKML